MVIVALLPVTVSVASIADSSPCFILPVYVPERSVCSCCIGSQRPVRRGVDAAIGVSAGIALVSAAASGEAFGRGRRWRRGRRRGFAILLFAFVIVVEE